MRDSDFQEVVVTDTLPLDPTKKAAKVKVLSIAPLLGEAINRIHLGPVGGDTLQHPQLPRVSQPPGMTGFARLGRLWGV